MTEAVIPLLHARRRRAERAQLVLQIPAAAVLLLQAAPNLSGAAGPLRSLLALLQVCAVLALGLSVVRELAGRPGWSRVAAVDLLAGLLLLLEWAADLADGGKFLGPVLLAGIATTALGLVPTEWRRRRRALRLSAEGLAWRSSPLRPSASPGRRWSPSPGPAGGWWCGCAAVRREG